MQNLPEKKSGARALAGLCVGASLVFGMVQVSSAASCGTNDVIVDGMIADACGWTDGSGNDDVGGAIQPGNWDVNVNGDGGGGWNAYYKQDINETDGVIGVPPTFGSWSDPDEHGPDVVYGKPIDLQITSFTGAGDNPASSGTFTVDGRSPGGELLITLFAATGDYHWYVFSGKIGDDLPGSWDTTVPFGGANLSNITAYEIGGGDPPSLVPVPAAVWLFGSGLLGMIGIARRRRS